MSARAQPPTSVLIQDAILFLRWDAGPARGPARDRRSGADRSGADQGFIDDSLAGDGVLAPERLPKPVVAVELGGDGEQALDGRDVRFALGHRIEAAGIGEGVEIEGAVVAVAPDLAEQLKRSAHMDRSHHEPIVPLGVTVVQVQAEKPAAAMDEMSSQGRLLAGVASASGSPATWSGKFRSRSINPSTVAARSTICIIVGFPARLGQNRCGAEPKELSRVAKRERVMVSSG